jgi:hypothetical protein
MRPASGSRAATSASRRSRKTAAASRPRVPPPTTRTRERGSAPERRTARSATAVGSAKTASSTSTPGGTAWALRAGKRSRRARAPSRFITPVSCRRGHSCASPTANPLPGGRGPPPGPSTRARAPGVAARGPSRRYTIEPSSSSRSVAHSPTASGASSRSPGSAGGTSWSSSAWPPAPEMTSARIRVPGSRFRVVGRPGGARRWQRHCSSP